MLMQICGSDNVEKYCLADVETLFQSSDHRMDPKQTSANKDTEDAAPQQIPGDICALTILKLSLPKNKSFQHIPSYAAYYYQ